MKALPDSLILPINGIDMHIETRGQGEPLVLLHGFTGAGSDWWHVFNEQPRGYQLIQPDLRGHGRSTNPGDRFTFRQCAADVLAMLDALDIGRFQAIGLSGGAQTLLHIATQQPARVEAMVLVSGAHYFPAPARALMGQTTLDQLPEAELKAMHARHHHGEAQIRALVRQAQAFQDSHDDVNFAAADLAGISARTLIVHGDRDPLYPVALAAELHAAIGGSHLWIVPNGGHGPIFGARAGQFLEIALPFLQGEWSGRQATR
jgi:pimeloyl-ACP methyl ester carboxylesterase